MLWTCDCEIQLHMQTHCAFGVFLFPIAWAPTKAICSLLACTPFAILCKCEQAFKDWQTCEYCHRIDLFSVTWSAQSQNLQCFQETALALITGHCLKPVTDTLKTTPSRLLPVRIHELTARLPAVNVFFYIYNCSYFRCMDELSNVFRTTCFDCVQSTALAPLYLFQCLISDKVNTPRCYQNNGVLNWSSVYAVWGQFGWKG